MSQSVVLRETPVARFPLWKPVRPFSVITVYATVDGKVECPGHPLSRWELLSGRYRTMYEIDEAPQSVAIQDLLPSRNDSFNFAVNAVVEWRVSDAAKIISQRADGRIQPSVVRSAMARMVEVSRRYDIEDFTSVQNGCNRLTDRQPIELPGLGVMIESITAHVTHDDATKQYLQQHKHIDRQLSLGQRGHVLDTQLLRHENELERERHAAVASMIQGEFGLITAFLRRHPDEPLTVLQMMRDQQAELEQRRQSKFANAAAVVDKLLETGNLQDVDMEPLRDAAVQMLRSSLADGTTSGGEGPAGSAQPSAAWYPVDLPKQSRPAAGLPAASEAVPGESIDSDGVVEWQGFRPQRGRGEAEQ